MWTILDVRDSAKGPVHTVKRRNSAPDGDIFFIKVINNIFYIFFKELLLRKIVAKIIMKRL